MMPGNPDRRLRWLLLIAVVAMIVVALFIEFVPTDARTRLQNQPPPIDEHQARVSEAYEAALTSLPAGTTISLAVWNPAEAWCGYGGSVESRSNYRSKGDSALPELLEPTGGTVFRSTYHPLLGTQRLADWNLAELQGRVYTGSWELDEHQWFVNATIRLPDGDKVTQRSFQVFRSLIENSFQIAREKTLRAAAPLALYRRGPFEPRQQGSELIECFYQSFPDRPPHRNISLIDPRPGQMIADIGCGTGGAARRIAEISGPETTVVARDVNEKSIQKAIDQHGEVNNVSYAVSQRDNVSIDAATVDLAYMVQVLASILQQTETQIAFTQSMFAALKPGGEFVIIQYKCTAEDRKRADRLFADAGFQPGRKMKVWTSNGRNYYTVLEYRKPLNR